MPGKQCQLVDLSEVLVRGGMYFHYSTRIHHLGMSIYVMVRTSLKKYIQINRPYTSLFIYIYAISQTPLSKYQDDGHGSK